MFSFFNSMSLRNISFLFVLSSLFSYFVLSHNNATIFFGIFAYLLLLTHSYYKDRFSQNDAIHDRIDAVNRDIDDRMSHENDSLWSAVNRIEDELAGVMSNNKKR